MVKMKRILGQQNIFETDLKVTLNCSQRQTNFTCTPQKHFFLKVSEKQCLIDIKLKLEKQRVAVVR